MLQAGQFVGSVRPTNVNLQRCHADGSISMRKEVVKNVEDGRLGHDKLLQVFRMEVVTVNINGRQENRLHLVVAKFVRWLVSSNQHLLFDSKLSLATLNQSID